MRRIERRLEEIAKREALREKATEKAREEAVAAGFEEGQRKGAAQAMAFDAKFREARVADEARLRSIAFQAAAQIIGAFDETDRIRRIMELAITRYCDQEPLRLRAAPERCADLDAALERFSDEHVDPPLEIVATIGLEGDTMLLDTALGVVNLTLCDQIALLAELMGVDPSVQAELAADDTPSLQDGVDAPCAEAQAGNAPGGAPPAGRETSAEQRDAPTTPPECESKGAAAGEIPLRKPKIRLGGDWRRGAAGSSDAACSNTADEAVKEPALEAPGAASSESRDRSKPKPRIKLDRERRRSEASAAVEARAASRQRPHPTAEDGTQEIGAAAGSVATRERSKPRIRAGALHGRSRGDAQPSVPQLSPAVVPPEPV
ncbi:MAG: hypothetical protein AAGM38_15825 [Pseudomonadota bacterium]